MFSYFQPKYLKQARLLQKGVKKFLKYKEDILSEEKRAKIDAASAEFDAAIAAKDKEKVKETAKSLTKVCEKSVPQHKNSALRENVEVIFVAFVIAIGIRSYFLQPFKIPTGSMQPTLNGVKATDLSQDPEHKHPNFVSRILSKAIKGRSWVDITMKEDGYLTGIREETKFKFFTYTKFIFQDSSKNFKIPAPIAVVTKSVEDDGFGVVEKLRELGVRIYQDQITGKFTLTTPGLIEKGTLIARGKIDTGDQVLVDKMSYHFRRPNRGEVFVFNTRRIKGVRRIDPQQESQHYIKRLTGIPGDKVEIRPKENALPDNGVRSANILVNGEPPNEPGMLRVEEEYDGYIYYSRFRYHQFDLSQDSFEHKKYGERPYLALGDNSRNSSDSRDWGVVPEQNVVGPAFTVYWPFTNHWGLIK
ncbi:MAG: signal peptidase I [Verrucomicrobiota bacterium]